MIGGLYRTTRTDASEYLGMTGAGGTEDPADGEYRAPHQPLVAPAGVELHLRDMTATFAADLPLRLVQWRLQEHGQWLPIDGDPAAPIGTLVSENSTGPLRLGYGAWRDLLLGVQFLNGNGELITAGGRTVKNVAGYDLTKFMVGQRGVFGKLITLTARTYRRPERALLVRHRPDVGIVGRLIPTPLRPQWAVLTPDALWCGYLGDETTAAWYESALRGAGGREALTNRGVQEDIDHRAELWSRMEGPIRIRASVPPARLSELATTLGGSRWVADAAFGILRASASDEAEVERIRRAAGDVGGSVLIARDNGPPAFDPSTNPVERQIITRLKQAFDPEQRLTPLPW
jgi:glycolate oxidase FAD binding subunit